MVKRPHADAAPSPQPQKRLKSATLDEMYDIDGAAARRHQATRRDVDAAVRAADERDDASAIEALRGFAGAFVRAKRAQVYFAAVVTGAALAPSRKAVLTVDCGGPVDANAPRVLDIARGPRCLGLVRASRRGIRRDASRTVPRRTAAPPRLRPG